MSRNTHNIWIGSPRTNNTNEPGHDLIGSFSFMNAVDKDKTRVNFWCLDQNKSHYYYLLRNTDIQVHSIEFFLQEKALQGGEIGALAIEVQRLLSQILDTSADRGKIRDYITAKEVFAFFLLATEGGLVADTNVLADAKHVAFHEHRNFRMLGFHGNVTTDENDTDADVCVLYSNPKNPTHSIQVLKTFLKAVNAIENDKSIPKNSPEYNKAILHCVIKAALLKDFPDRDVSYFTALRLGRNFPVKVIDENCRLLKRYYNTHGAQDRGALSDLMKAVVLGNVSEVKKCLDAGDDINEIMHTEDYCNITPLNAAVFYGHKEIAKLLLALGAKNRELKLKAVVLSAGFFSDKKIEAQGDAHTGEPSKKHHA